MTWSIAAWIAVGAILGYLLAEIPGALIGAVIGYLALYVAQAALDLTAAGKLGGATGVW